eukprot:CAMPEP_0178427210 /NCGR_PEP_ID=MMETSP0689_2-20121128/29625_1 /TAXON_ID=160604 /ORGANISM="Amphidinium massartii, Strain CS-259" /LENGTH=499 /DNA_ID=CAMNT_0020048905 /DNA_START=8 /DNA_END=1504 /DNA_ORIENTATION=-
MVARRILIVSQGSRGDIQPFIALGLGLQKAGFQVKITTNANHAPFAASFGLDAHGNCIDVEEEINGNPKILEAMAKGQFAKFAAALGDVIDKKALEVLKDQLAVIEEFRPELLITSALDTISMRMIAYAKNIPLVTANLQNGLPTTCTKSWFDEPECVPRFHFAMWMVMIFMIHQNDLKKYKVWTKDIGVPGVEGFLETYLQHMYIDQNPEFRPIVACSAAVSTPITDLSKAATQNWTGPWIIQPDEQLAQVAQGTSYFGTKIKDAEVKSFLASGEVPVFMGWGSMVAVSADYMAKFAVAVLKKVGRRGIVLGGVAHLSSKGLEGSPELQAYAEKNVLFLDTASHENLFKCCAVLVHHGGMGTTTAAYRSGVPQVIMPIFTDQYLSAEQAQRNGVGFAMPQFQKCKLDLVADKIQACLVDAKIIAKAKEIGETLRAEDGVSRGVDAITGCFQEIDSGAWQRKQDKNKAVLLSAKCRRHPSCFAWLYRAFCMSDYNNYTG